MAKKSESRETEEKPEALLLDPTIAMSSEEQAAYIQRIKDLAQAYIDFLHELGDKSGGLNHDLTEARKLAITSAMWAVRSITA